MAGGFSDFLEDKILDGILNGTLYAFPTTVYLRLYEAAPTDAGGGTELTQGGYAAKALVGAFDKQSVGVWKNTVAQAIGPATENWPTIVAMALWDAATGGNMLLWGTLNTNQDIASAGTAQFDPAKMKWTLD